MSTSVSVIGTGSLKLATGIDGQNCEVAVTRFVIPSKYYNIGKCVVKIKVGGETSSHVFPGGHYSSLRSVMETLGQVVPAGDPPHTFKFSFDEDQMLASIHVVKARTSLILPPQLSHMLKMPHTVRGYVVSEGPVNVWKRYMLLQADFVQPQLFNETMKPVLYIAHDTDCSHQLVKTPVFIPVTKRYLDVMKLYITDENDQPIDFINGLPLIQLCFRHKY